MTEFSPQLLSLLLLLTGGLGSLAVLTFFAEMLERSRIQVLRHGPRKSMATYWSDMESGPVAPANARKSAM